MPNPGDIGATWGLEGEILSTSVEVVSPPRDLLAIKRVAYYGDLSRRWYILGSVVVNMNTDRHFVPVGLVYMIH